MSSVILATTTPVALPWIWRTVQGNNQVLVVQPMPLGTALAALGARSPWGAAATLHDRRGSRWWLMSFVRPLDEPLLLESSMAPAAAPLSADEWRLRALSTLGARPPLSAIASWAAAVLKPAPAPDFPEVPLLQVPGAAVQTGTVAVQAPSDADASSWAVETRGLVRDLVRPAVGTRQEVYRYDDNPLSLRGLGTRKTDDTSVRIDGAELIVAADPSDRQRCLCRFRVKNGGKAKLAIRLPAGAQVHALAVAGQPLPGEALHITAEPGHTLCEAPIPSPFAWQRVEVLYSVTRPAWTLTTELSPFAPVLPAAHGNMRIVWRLPPDVAPSSSNGLALLPGGAAPDRSLSWPGLADRAGNAVESPRRPAAEPSAKAPPIGKGTTTVRTVQQLFSGAGSFTEKPLIDAVALADADVQPSTPTPDGDLKSFGLVFVPFPGGQILTTPRQASLWNGESASALPPSIREAVEQAVRHGRDESGRFRTVDDWLESPGVFQEALLPLLGGDGPGWTAWEVRRPVAAAPLAVVRTGEIAIAGWLIAAVLSVLGFLIVGRLGRTRVVLLLGWLVVSGGALIALPPAWSGLAFGPFLAALLVAIVSACMRRPGQIKAPKTVVARLSSRSGMLPTGATTTVLLLGLGIPSTADAPAPAVVYLLPGRDGDLEPKNVLLTPELRDRLALLEKPRLALNEAAFVRAHYTGRAEASGAAEFEAQFHVVSFVEQATLVLPLGDVRLREALLDGAAAFPRPMGNDRIAVDLNGKGEHRIDVKFTAAFVGTGPDREVRFAAPELAVCRLDFTAPPASEQVRAVNWRGAQIIDDDGRLHADLGRARSIQVRWRQPGGGGSALVRVQEASVWDIDPAIATLFTSFEYRITQGSATSFKVILPHNLEVARVEVRPDVIPPGAPPTWVRDWSIGPNRLLTVELQSALSGSARLLLESVPIRPLTARPVLQAPVAAGGAETEAAYLAYRLRGLETPVEIEPQGSGRIDARGVPARRLARTSGAEKSPAPVTRAFRIGKADGATLRPLLRPTPAASRADQELIWWLGARSAQVQGTAHWTAAAAPLSFVEWEVPFAVEVHDVRGLGLHSWLRSGNRVSAWLREPAVQATLVWHGSQQRGALPGEVMTFDAPSIRLDGAAASSTILRLRAPEGWIVALDGAVAPGKPVPPLADRELALELPRPGAPARFQVRVPQADSAFRILKVAEVVERKLQMSASIEPLVRRDRPHSFAVVVRDGDGWAIDWQLPAGCRAQPLAGAADTREWIVDIPPREPDPLVLGLRLQRVLDAKQELTLPQIVIRQGDQILNVERRLALIGPELREAEMIGLSRDTEALDAVLSARPLERERGRERGGSLWRADGPDARARLVVSPVPLGAATMVHVALADLEAAPQADRWIFRATFDLRHESGAALRCILPSGATLEGWALEGIVLPVARTVSGFNVPLPAEGGTRLLQLVWSAPSLSWDPPRLEMAGQRFNPDVVLWTATAHTGARLDTTAAFGPAQADLRRADALVKLAVESNAAGAGEVQVSRLAARAARWVRLADANLAGPRSEARNEERGLGGVALADWSTRLRDQAGALRQPRKGDTPPPAPLSLRDTTFEQLPFADAFHQGVPIHWLGPATDVRLRAVAAWSPLSALAAFGLLALAAAVLALLMLAAPVITRPEQVAVIALIGLIVFGAPVGYAFIPICAAAILVRLGWLGNRFLRWVGG